ncbi:polymorphic toxin type 35 domain-containing protein [Mediterraneibacter sp.]
MWKKRIIDGYEVEVTYNKLSDGTVRISDAWINP